jgi:probable phosphoglycerate mutase
MKYTTLLIIRHGQTDWNISGKIQGHIDNSLNEKGHEQALNVASFLKNKNLSFGALYSSDLQRAHQTAQPISEAFSLDVVTTPLLRERQIGAWEGCTKQEWYESHGEHVDFDLDIIPGGEAKTEFLKRVVGQITLIAQNHIGEAIIVVSHAIAIRSYLGYLGYDINQWPPITNTSIITVKYHHAEQPHIELVSIECPG